MCSHHLLDRLDLRIVTALVQERAIVLVIDGVAGNVKNLLLEPDEFVFELDLVHRTIVGLFCVLFHAAKLRHEDAKEWQERMREYLLSITIYHDTDCCFRVSIINVWVIQN